MDSRLKICGLSSKIPGGATVVRGYFDPLLADHARRLHELPRPVVVVVADPPEPLLPLASRQLLVAALECVECVLGPEDATGVRVSHDWTADDMTVREGFIRHVRERSQA